MIIGDISGEGDVASALEGEERLSGRDSKTSLA